MPRVPAFCLISLAAAFLFGGESLAQSYPTKPVRMLVAFPPGTGVDILARSIGQKLSERWGQPVLIENRPGAGGSLGTAAAAKSPPDGYTITMGNLGTHALNASLYKQLGYHPQRDFVPVAQVAAVPMLLVVHPALPVKSVRTFLELARSKPGELNYGSAGVGSVGHLSGELFALVAGIRIVHVPYKGNQQALTDLLVGQVQMAFGNLLSYLPHARSGRVRSIAVTSRERSAAASDIPTMVEAGLKDFEVTQWYGVFAPANTPAAVADKLNADIAEVLRMADVRSRLENDGASVGGPSRDQFGAAVGKEIERWGQVIRKANIQQ